MLFTTKTYFVTERDYSMYMYRTGTGVKVHARYRTKEDMSCIAVVTLWSSVGADFEFLNYTVECL
jgi:hypothetical protein